LFFAGQHRGDQENCNEQLHLALRVRQYMSKKARLIYAAASNRSITVIFAKESSSGVGTSPSPRTAAENRSP
jgi:hypothetical protein